MATYTTEQLAQYFDRIQLPDKHRAASIRGFSDSESLEFLSVLQKYQLAAIPFENLSLHYSQHKSMVIHDDGMFRDIVLRPGRGGYCMQNNKLFGTVLRTLGYQLYSAGGRVSKGDVFTGLTHAVNIVTISERKYMVDVGFGPQGPIKPQELVKNEDPPVNSNIEPAMSRMLWSALERHTDPNQRVWIYQYRYNDQSPWLDIYHCSEMEFLAEDFEVSNYYTSTNRTAWFTREIVCNKRIMKEGLIIGNLTLTTRYFKRKIGGKSETQVTFEREQDRLNALNEHFGITFDQAEKDGIRGLSTEIVPRN